MITFHWSKDSKSKSIKLDEVVAFLNKVISDYNQKYYPSLCKNGPYTTITTQVGRKYIKLMSNTGGQQSVYCFLDMKGNIYKAASWSAPAKHVRGSVFDPSFGWGKALNHYGAAYLR
jgi:hypothetical protein